MLLQLNLQFYSMHSIVCMHALSHRCHLTIIGTVAVCGRRWDLRRSTRQELRRQRCHWGGKWERVVPSPADMSQRQSLAVWMYHHVCERGANLQATIPVIVVLVNNMHALPYVCWCRPGTLSSLQTNSNKPLTGLQPLTVQPSVICCGKLKGLKHCLKSTIFFPKMTTIGIRPSQCIMGSVCKTLLPYVTLFRSLSCEQAIATFNYYTASNSSSLKTVVR